jgi:hypothetical protein
MLLDDNGMAVADLKGHEYLVEVHGLEWCGLTKQEGQAQPLEELDWALKVVKEVTDSSYD